MFQLNDPELANVAITAGATSLAVANTAQDAVASPLSGRKHLYLYNPSNKDVFIGPSGVTVANGFPLPPGALLNLRAGSAIDIEAVSATASTSIRYMELS
jgi:hypothetical protein